MGPSRFSNKVNHYNIKREAHSVSRSSTDQAWNPFRHVSWSAARRQTAVRRAGTWDHPQVESNNVDGGAISHSQTLPNRVRGPMPTTEASTSDTAVQPIPEVKDAETEATAKRSTESQSGLRNRKPDDSPIAAKVDTASDDDKSKKEKKEKEGLIRHVYPKVPFTIANQLQRTFLNSWINILIFAAPVGIALHFGKVNVPDWVLFLVNFIAIVPLAAMLSFATEEIALRTGETIGGLLNATFGNAVELIIAIIALSQNQVAIVQTSLVGSILSNLLLVLGFCFFFGGLRRTEQYFNTTVAQTAASLLALAVASVIVPSVFDFAVQKVYKEAVQQSDRDHNVQADVAKISRGTSVILLLVYAAYLFFQLKTHQDVFNEESQKVEAKPWNVHLPGSKDKNEGFSISQGLALPGGVISQGMARDNSNEQHLSHMLMNPPRQASKLEHDENGEEEEEDEEPQLSFAVAVATLAISTVIIALCSEAMVGSIDGITNGGKLSKEFVGLILLPIVGNAAEHATAVTVAMKDKMDLAIGVAVGSSMQVALFLIPLLVVIGWGMGNEYMDLSFDMFQVAVMFVAVLLVNYLIADGKSHWLEGYLLICLYAIIAVCTFCKCCLLLLHHCR